jgi:hypothetical protein
MQQISVPEAPISAEILQYCSPPLVVETDDLKKALQITVANHELYAICYLQQRSLVDTIRRRQTQY